MIFFIQNALQTLKQSFRFLENLLLFLRLEVNKVSLSELKSLETHSLQCFR